MQNNWNPLHAPLFVRVLKFHNKCIFYYSDCAATDPDNGEVTATTAIHGATVTFSCDLGFIIQGTATATCNDGTLTAATCASGIEKYDILLKG